MTDQCKTKTISSAAAVMDDKENNSQENLIHLKVMIEIDELSKMSFPCLAIERWLCIHCGQDGLWEIQTLFATFIQFN